MCLFQSPSFKCYATEQIAAILISSAARSIHDPSLRLFFVCEFVWDGVHTGHSDASMAATTIVGIVLACSVFAFLCYTLCCKRGERVPLSITSGDLEDDDSRMEMDTLPDVYNLSPVGASLCVPPTV